MQTFYLIITVTYLFTMGFCFEPKSCTSCKWFVDNKNRPEYGLCNLFKEKIYIADQERLICNFAKHCRVNELLCGKEGRMHEDKDSVIAMEEKLKEFENQYDELMYKYDEYSNDGHGEVNEKPELDKLNELDKEIETFTKEGLELLFKVKNFNKRKIRVALDKLFHNSK